MNSTDNQSIRKAFGETLFKLAQTNSNIYVVSMDLKSSLHLNDFAKKFPHRFIECGIAENNAAAVAAGLAKTGKTVFLCSFACFSPAINWAVIRQSICYNNLNVKIVGSHAGLMTADLGATHQILEDVALMSALPNMEVFAPVDAYETQKITTVLSRSRRPAYLRLVRPDTPIINNFKNTFTIGKSQIIKKGKDITIIGYGPILHQALLAQEQLSLSKPNISLEIINCSSIKPLDFNTITKSLKKTGRLICLEDHQQNGGLGSIVATQILNSKLRPKFIHLSVNNQFGQSAKNYLELYDHYGLGVKNLIAAAKKLK
ncbi:MAG: transketolase family protein [Candidatus Shapirobacteria bacterium]|nr:transketolase family protein [Candidatus Shapirobacteria bacterium]